MNNTYISIHTETNRDSKAQRLIIMVDANNIITPFVVSMLDANNNYRIEYLYILRIAKLMEINTTRVVELLTNAMQEYKKQNTKETFTFTFNLPKHN
jgi:hypothetical protein